MSSAKEVTPPPPPRSAAEAPPPPPSVHPIAKWVAGLFSPMSLLDQDFISAICHYMIWGSFFISYPIAFYMEKLLITVVAVGVATAVSMVVAIPNWRQRPDPEMRYANDAAVYAYYQQYKAALEAAKEPKKENEESAEKEKTE